MYFLECEEGLKIPEHAIRVEGKVMKRIVMEGVEVYVGGDGNREEEKWFRMNGSFVMKKKGEGDGEGDTSVITYDPLKPPLTISPFPLPSLTPLDTDISLLTP